MEKKQNGRTAESPAISVLMSVLNGARFLKPAIESILGQTFIDFEFVVIDDGSTDDSVSIVNSYDDPRIRLLVSGCNKGLSEALNRGLMECRAPYIARMDCDDVSAKDRLAKQYAYLEVNRSVGVVGTSYRLLKLRGRYGVVTKMPKSDILIKWMIPFISSMLHGSVMMRRQLILDAAGYSNEYEHAEDVELWWRLSKYTQYANLQMPLLLLRKHGSNVTMGKSHCENSERVSKAIFESIMGCEVPLPIVKCVKWGKCSDGVIRSQASRLIIELFKKFVVNYEVMPEDMLLIKRDVAQRLFKIWLGGVRALSINRIFYDAHSFDPIVGFRVGFDYAKRRVSAINGRWYGI